MIASTVRSARGSIARSVQEFVRRHALDSPVLTTPSLVVQDLDDPSSRVELNAAVPYYPACMIKLPMAIALGTSIAAGDHGWDEEVVVNEEAVTDSFFGASFTAGERVAVSTLCYKMLFYSDNCAFNVVLDLVGRQYATEIVQRFGMRSTYLRRYLSGSVLLADKRADGRNEHPPVDAALAFGGLADARFPESATILRHLRRDAGWYREALASGPSESVYQKDGVTSSVHHEGLLLEIAGRRYAVALYTALGSNAEPRKRCWAFLAELAGLLRGA